ncbi:helix-turn-helix transcriptional regulator [Fructobacillus cardui]|uniref:XRE-family HTH domain (XRE) n=1 Tax=Fructobacillus cardui TaxID=2893170 RepID=A0ABN9Z480_9LACO|nr:DNA-binding transcriptional regulator [Fructobacillus cardui]
MEFGQHLKQVRTQKKMSQQTLANLLFVTRQTISHWENGKNYPDFNLLIRLSDILDLSLDDLLREDEKMKASFTEQDAQGLLKPIYRWLLLIDLCFAMILFLDEFNVIHLKIWGFILVAIALFALGYVLRRLARIDRYYHFGMHYSWQNSVYQFLHPLDRKNKVD